MKWQVAVGALAWCAAAGSFILAADPPKRVRDQSEPAVAGERHVAQDGKILAAQTFRSSKLIGMNVRNLQGEALGSIDDLVVDVATGKVQYAAVSVGGLLGVGDKLLAVPFRELKFDHGQDEMFFVLDMSKEKIAAAPGFNQNDWPDFADPKWAAKIEQHYRRTETRTGAQEKNNAPRADE